MDIYVRVTTTFPRPPRVAGVWKLQIVSVGYRVRGFSLSVRMQFPGTVMEFPSSLLSLRMFDAVRYHSCLVSIW